MRIQLLSMNYPPEVTGIAPYSAALARHLSHRHDVTVLTGLPHYPDWQVAAEHRRWRTEQIIDGVRVIRLRHYVPSRPSAFGRAAYEVSWSIRAACAGLRLPADLVVSVVPALLGAHAGRLIARGHRAPLGVVVQDVMGAAAAQSGYRGGRVVSRATRSIERSALRNAHATATIHPKLAEHLRGVAKLPSVPRVIYNWTHVATRPTARDLARDRLGWGNDEVIVLHSGNMGSKQNLEVVVDAAKLAEREGDNVFFVLAGGGSQRSILVDRAGTCRNLRFLDTMPEQEFMDTLGAADVLLINERPGVVEMSLPSKLTSYFLAARPIVAATGLGSATRDFVLASGGGIVTRAGDPQGILESVREIAASEELATTLARRGRDFAELHLSEGAALAVYDEWVDELLRFQAVAPQTDAA